MRHIFFLFLICFITTGLTAQTDATWNNKKCAVVLTYDDALNIDLDNVIPCLDSFGFKATFYLSASFPGCSKRIEDWKAAAAKGYELGNHTLFHPCIGNTPGREWVNPENDMSKYTVKRMLNEIRMTNIFLQALDGKTERTFAYPCGDTKINDTAYIDSVRNDFIAARGTNYSLQNIQDVDIFNIDCFGANGNTGEELIKQVQMAMQQNKLLVFLFHGVGGEHNLNVSLAAHSMLIHFLADHKKDIWVAPMIDVAKFIKQQQ